MKNSQYIDLAHDLEIDKAIMFLKQKDFNQAIETLKSFEKKDSKVACTAATNLSFLYFLVSVFTINIKTPGASCSNIVSLTMLLRDQLVLKVNADHTTKYAAIFC